MKRRHPTILKPTSHKKGLPPGSMVYIGNINEETELNTIRYNKKLIEEDHPSNALLTPQAGCVDWLNVTGLTNTEFISKIGAHFSLHPLVLEDIVNTAHRPKVEDFGDYVYFVLKMLSLDSNGQMQIEHVSLILGESFVISFQERPGDVFDSVRERLRSAKGKFRERGADYLFYALIDSIVDNYFIVLEHTTDELEGLEEMALRGKEDGLTQHLYHTKRNLLLLRKSIWPLREMLSALIRDTPKLIDEKSLAYFRDIYDHTIQVIDTVEALRDVTASVREMHMTEISNRMNSIMKVLTIIATIFIPITFIAGVYGMNFEFMPELKWKFAYPATWLLFLAIGAGMLWFFKRKKWF
jgi:magnesium transporter